MKKKVGIAIGIIFAILTILALIKVNFFQGFLWEYQTYLSKDIEHQAKLFESIISGISGGAVTFIALYITIKHENKKEEIRWQKERKKAKEERLLSVRPFLNIECTKLSISRGNRHEERIDSIKVGNGKYHRYAQVRISNHGYGKCNKICLGGNKCSIEQLDVDEEKNLTIYFLGFMAENITSNFDITFSYQDIFGNKYTQVFSCVLKGEKQEIEIDIGEPLLKEGDD